MIMRLWAFFFLCYAVTCSSQSLGYKTDFIRYLDNDGISYKDYTKVISNRNRSWHYVHKGKSPEEVYSFTSPRDYKFQALLDERYNQMWFDEGSFSLIREDKMYSTDLIIKNDRFIFQNNYKSSKERYYGFCAAVPKEFSEVNYVWVFLDRFDEISYEANVEGAWTLIDNTLSFTAEGVNNILFKIEYKIREEQAL